MMVNPLIPILACTSPGAPATGPPTRLHSRGLSTYPGGGSPTGLAISGVAGMGLEQRRERQALGNVSGRNGGESRRHTGEG